MDDQYFADEFNNIPTEIKPYDKKASIELIWENKVGDNDANNLNLIFSEEFVIAATSDGSLRKMQMATGETVWEKEISEEIMIGVGGDFENILFITKNSYLWCLDSEGNAIWKIFIDGEVLTTPVINNKKAYVRLANYEILQIDLKQGDIDWRVYSFITCLSIQWYILFNLFRWGYLWWVWCRKVSCGASKKWCIYMGGKYISSKRSDRY